MQFTHIHFGSSSVPPYFHTTGLGKTILRRHEGGENHEGDEDHSTSFICMENSS